MSCVHNDRLRHLGSLLNKICCAQPRKIHHTDDSNSSTFLVCTPRIDWGELFSKYGDAVRLVSAYNILLYVSISQRSGDIKGNSFSPLRLRVFISSYGNHTYMEFYCLMPPHILSESRLGLCSSTSSALLPH